MKKHITTITIIVTTILVLVGCSIDGPPVYGPW